MDECRYGTGVTVHGKKEMLKIPRYYLQKMKLLGCRFFDLVVSFSVEVPEDQADLVDLHTYTHSYSRLLQCIQVVVYTTPYGN